MVDEQRYLIRLEIDQEVFIDVVRDGDMVEDATVATEVTSFERVGDAYVLEGAVLFAGYLRRAAGDNITPGGSSSVSALLGEGDVEHFHHRMPFILRVPVRAQPRGVLNVASRILSWRLDAAGEGWLRVTAELQVTGLNSSEGYHFECGAQRAGDLFFAEDAAPGAGESVQAGASAAWPSGPSTDSSTEPEEMGQKDPELELVRGTLPGDTRDAEPEDWRNVADAVSEARAGHGHADGGLGDYDRAFDGASSESHSAREQAPAPHTQKGLENAATVSNREHSTQAAEREDSSPSTDASREEAEAGAAPETHDTAVQPAPNAADTVAEFEFSHQIGPDEETQAAPLRAADEDFVASRSFTSDGFKATAGFVPNVHVQARAAEDEIPAAADEVDDALTLGRDKEKLWSFVDFHAPERSYTLRFVVVSEEETLDSVAERVGCSKSELMRANRLDGDTVHPGQTLMVPVVRVGVVR